MRAFFRIGGGALVALGLGVSPLAAAPAADGVAELASRTFLLSCVAYQGDYDTLRQHLQPGQDLSLPPLTADAARPYLRGREGDAWVRADAGLVLALLRADRSCILFVRKVGTEALARRLETDLRAGLGGSFTVRAAGDETRQGMRARSFDLIPTGSYREALARQLGGDPPGARVVLTTADGANPDLQAILTIGTRPSP
ncbi:MAG: hypothetical protein RLZZ501_1548 [Pseudomonadota bacterium]|jgi:hypothetical protein